MRTGRPDRLRFDGDRRAADRGTYVGGTQTVTVNDGRRTVTNGPSAALNCIDDIQIRAH